MTPFEKTCPACDGDGELATSHRFTCYWCKGSGRITDPKKYDEVVESERQMVADWNRSLSASEYRRMGG